MDLRCRMIKAACFVERTNVLCGVRAVPSWDSNSDFQFLFSYANYY